MHFNGKVLVSRWQAAAGFDIEQKGEDKLVNVEHSFIEFR